MEDEGAGEMRKTNAVATDVSQIAVRGSLMSKLSGEGLSYQCSVPCTESSVIPYQIIEVHLLASSDGKLCNG